MTHSTIAKAQNSFAAEHGQLGKLTVLYSGNLGLSHDLNTMIEAARSLRAHSDIHFLTIGQGSQWEALQQAANELDNLSLLPYQPVNVIPYSLTTGDVAVISLDRGLEGVSFPSKTQFMMAAGAALIGLGHHPNDIQMTIDEYQCGVNVEPGDVDGFAGAVLRFRDDPVFLDACRSNSRKAAEEYSSRGYEVARIIEEIASFMVSQKNEE